LWVYLAAVAVALYAYEKHKKAAGAAAPVSAAGAGTATGAIDPNTGIPYSQETGAASESEVEQTLQANVQGATTNPQWEANAESVLVGYGYPDVQVQSALNTYLAGGVLSSIQQEIVNATIAAVGGPPTAPTKTSTSSTTPSNPPTTTPAKPTQGNPAPATGTKAKPKFGTITIGGKEYAILGKAGSSALGVTGGAPVFFGDGNAVAQGAAAKAGAERDNGYAYTPIEYANLIDTQ
jgi:hypothetical protein